MRNFVLGLAFSVAFILGVGFSMSVQPAQAATSGRYKDCFAVKSYTMTGSNLNAGMAPQKVVHIPKGWTVVGGGGAYILLCR